MKHPLPKLPSMRPIVKELLENGMKTERRTESICLLFEAVLGDFVLKQSGEKLDKKIAGRTEILKPLWEIIKRQKINRNSSENNLLEMYEAIAKMTDEQKINL